MPRRKKPKSPKTLHEAIEKLPDPDVQGKDIKQLALMLLLESTETTSGHMQAKVAALKLLADLVKEENRSSEDGSPNQLSNEALAQLLSRKEN